MIRALFAAALLALVPLAPRAAEDPALSAVAPWFSIGDEAQALWSAALPDPDDHGRILLTRRAPVAGPERTVLVIYPRRSSAYDTAMTTLLTDFAARPHPVRFLAVNYGRDPERGAALLAEARAQGHALVYAMGSETVAWLHADHPAPGLPVVTVCAKDPVQLGQVADYGPAGGDVAFTSLNVLLDVQVAHLLALRPGLRSLGVLVDETNASALETQALPIIAAVRARGIDAFTVAVTDPARAREQLAAAVPDAVARMRETDPDLTDSLFWITGSTSVFTEIATINAHAGRVPVLSVVPEVVREGDDSAVLSIGVAFETNARLAAVYGAEILAGRSRAGELPVGVVSPPDIAINFARARAIGLRAPFAFFETASFVYDADGRPVRAHGRDVGQE